jgi:hypothetical protein
MNLPNNDISQDDNFSGLWNVPDETPGTLDGAMQFSAALEGVLRDPTLEDLALGDFFSSENDPPPWVPDDQRLNTTSTLAVIENNRHDGQRISGLSSSTDSSLSTPSMDRVGSRMLDLPLENVEASGATWEHVEDAQLEEDPEDVLRRRSLDSLRSEGALNADREAVSFIFYPAEI